MCRILLENIKKFDVHSEKLQQNTCRDAGMVLSASAIMMRMRHIVEMCSEVHNEAVSSRTLASLSDDLDSICLIRECRDLDNYFLSDFTSVILQREADTCPIQPVINEEILSKDRKLRVAKHEGRPDLSVVVEEAIGWPKLWDLALDRGPNCIHGLRN